MIIPAKKLIVVAMRDREEEVLRRLGELGVIQLKKPSEKDLLRLTKGEEARLRELEKLYERFMEIWRALVLGVSETSKGLSSLEAGELRPSFIGFSPEEGSRLRSSRELYEKFMELKKTLSPEPVKHEEEVEIDPDEVEKIVNQVYTRYNTLSAKLREIEELERRLEEAGELINILERAGVREFPRDVRRSIGLPRDIYEAKAVIEEKSRELDERKVLIKKEIQELREDFRSKAGTISRFLSIRLRLDEALLKTMKSETLRVIQGWIPEDRVKSVGEALESLREEFDGKLLYEFRDPSPDEEVPTTLRNPRIFKMFETLVRQYGWPGYRESDPTIISGILWTAMFGLMFPDLGHGVTIAILGILFSRFLKKDILGLNLRKLGKLMIGLGIASAIFGVLMGEFFLMEIQPLFPTLRAGWLEDPSGVVWLIKTAVFFGITQILLALSVSVRNHLRNRELAEAILGEKGVAGILLLFGLALTAFNFLGITVIPGILEFPELKMKALTSWPFFVLVAGLIMILVKPFFTREEKVMGVGLVLETFISFLANMFSYMRIAGFAIVHAALAMVVFRLMQANPLMGIGIGLIFLNLFALTIEFLVCMIQALRLLYYEFMTKFYQGTGTPYTPWKL